MPDGGAPPLHPEWTEETGPGGAPVYRHTSGLTTTCRCASPRCRAPFVPRNKYQRTCGERRCQWVVRENGAERKEAKATRFARWYAVPEKRRAHVTATLAARRRRRCAEQVLGQLAAGAAVPIAGLAAQAPPALLGEALAALWYTGRIAVDGDQVQIVPHPPARYLHLPPASVEVPAVLRALVTHQDEGPGGRPPSPCASRGPADPLRLVRRRTDGGPGARLTRLGRAPGGCRCDEPTALPRRVQAPAPDPWTLPAPAPPCPHLPGGGLVLHLEPVPARAIELGQARLLHGLITDLVDVPHDPAMPAWALVPWPAPPGWAVYLRSEDHVAALALGRHEGRLFGQPVWASFGAPIRLRYPPPLAPGRYQLRIDAVTPVCIRHNVTGSRAKTTHLTPAAENLLSALTQAFPTRIGLPGLDPGTAALRVVARRTEAVRVPCGSHLGQIRGWTGSVMVEANAVAAWLLGCAAQVGLGGRTALGFGRVRVSLATAADVATLSREVAPPLRPALTLSAPAVDAYVRTVGVTARQARRAMALELLHAVPEGAGWRGPEPLRALYVVRGGVVVTVGVEGAGER